MATWNGQIFASVGQGTTNTIAYSTDGISWIGVGVTIFSTAGYGISSNNTLFVAVGAGTNTIAYSSNAITWTGLGTTIISSAGNGITNNSIIWIATGSDTSNSIFYSPDGINWTPTTGKTIFSTQGLSVNNNNLKLGNVSIKHPFLGAGNGTINTLAYSIDGIKWIGLGNTVLPSTVRGLATANYISSLQLISTVTGLGNIYLSTTNSTIVGLGTFAYVSTTQLFSTTSGIGNTIIPSTVRGLGTANYVSSAQLQSTITGWSKIPAISYVNLNQYSLSNVSTINFVDTSFVSNTTATLRYDKSLLLFNNSSFNQVIGGSLQLIPQVISFPFGGPNTIANLGLWMDAADATSFVTSGGNISYWKDKSSNLNIFTPSATIAYTTNKVAFTTNLYFSSSNSLIFDTNTYIFMVASLSNFININMAFAFNDIFFQDYSLRYNAGGFNNGNSNDALWPTYYVNGISNGSTTYSNLHIIDGALNTSGTSIMRISSDFLSRYFIGTMNEILIYNGPSIINNTQINLIRKYLANKWSITL